MSIGTIMWICVGVSLVFCAAYFLISSNKERLAIEKQAKKLCEDIRAAYPEAKKQINEISIDESKVTVSVKERSDVPGTVYNLSEYGISSSGETTMSAVANYITDGFTNLEWKRSLNKTEKDSTVIMTGVMLKNISRLGYTDIKK